MVGNGKSATEVYIWEDGKMEINALVAMAGKGRSDHRGLPVRITKIGINTLVAMVCKGRSCLSG
jgi:hypothetical protein